jgi:hypothetical protein
MSRLFLSGCRRSIGRQVAGRALMADYPIEPGGRRRCVFVTVLWGDWHREVFLNSNLPTMLAPGNLPALSTGIDSEYLLYTTPQDALKMNRHPAFQRLRSIVAVSPTLFTPSKTKNIFVLHHEIWRTATEHARQQQAFVLLMPPDVAWADGSFAHLRDVLTSGKRAIFMTYPRVVSETIVPALAERFPLDAGEAMVVPPKDLMALAVTHIHPLMAAYNRAATHFPVHPEMILWPVEGDGFLLRLLARELFCFEPGHYQLNAQSLLAQMPPDDEIHVFRDSREFLGVSFAPLWKDMEWYLAPRALEPLTVGRWWIHYDSPMNDRLSAINLRFTCGSAEEVRWRVAEARANLLLTHLRSAREFVRILITLDRMGHTRAAAFLAAALRVHGLARRWPHRGPFIVLAPSDDAFKRVAFNRVPGDGMSAAEVRHLIEEHVASRPAANVLRDDAELTALSGRGFRLGNFKNAQQCGDHLIVPVDDLLWPDHAADAAPSLGAKNLDAIALGTSSPTVAAGSGESTPG